MNGAHGFTWAFLLHLGYNMWFERDAGHGPLAGGYAEDYCTASDTLRFDKAVWDEAVEAMRAAGIDTLVIDLGEGVRYESHPEIASKGAWSVDALRDELRRLRGKGFTIVPKLNFSATHDEWMGEMSRCVSSSGYYAFCRDLITEVIDIFGRPALFHIGMDEETIEHQAHNRYAVVRHADQWWHDLLYLVEQVEKGGARPWVWADRIWHHEEEYLRRMPREVLQSNWYYGGGFSPDIREVRAFHALEENGFEQVPAGSNWCSPWNFEGVVNYCRRNFPAGRISGFLQTVWRPTVHDTRYRILDAVDVARKARAGIEG